MATIHTYRTVQGTTETRTSKTRAYRACLVAVMTQEVIEGFRAEIAKAEARLAETTLDLSDLVAARGMTLEAAKAIYEQENHPLGDGQSYPDISLAEYKAVKAELGIEDNSQESYKRVDAEATRRLEARGIKNPQRKDGPADILQAGWCVEMHRRNIAHWTEKLQKAAVGNEEVISWHLSMANAEKALGTPGHEPKRNRYGIQAGPSEADRYRKQGYTIRISTTFEVRETKSRVKEEA